jgi:two-component system sensor histidine kinase DesK
VQTRSPFAVSRSVASLVLVVSLAYVAEPTLYWIRHAPTVSALFGAGAAVTAFGITFARTVWSSVVGGPGRNRQLLDLAICASAGFALCFAFGLRWTALPALMAGAAAIALSPRRSIGVGVLTLAGELLVALVWRAGVGETVDLLVRSGITIVVLAALGWLASFYDELFRGRAELARMAVMEERLRFARDLHDVLGHTLSVIGLKNEVAMLLIERDPGKAAKEIGDSLTISRRAVSDLRALVRGYRNQSLQSEIAGVASILELAGVACETDAVPSHLPQPVQEAAGWLVREGVTNILRHSKATRCRVRLRISEGRLTVELTNDNPGVGGGSSAGGGHGLAGLRERFATVHGTVDWGIDEEGSFSLRAEVPLDTGEATALDDSGVDRGGRDPDPGLVGDDPVV